MGMRKLHTFEFPPDLEARLRSYAEQTGETKSSIVREAVAAYLAQRPPAEASAYDLVADLAGSVEGTGDLSHNPEHLEGYGTSRSDFGRHRANRRLSRSKR
jgi:hypothetical protein